MSATKTVLFLSAIYLTCSAQNQFRSLNDGKNKTKDEDNALKNDFVKYVKECGSSDGSSEEYEDDFGDEKQKTGNGGTYPEFYGNRNFNKRRNGSFSLDRERTGDRNGDWSSPGNPNYSYRPMENGHSYDRSITDRNFPMGSQYGHERTSNDEFYGPNQREYHLNYANNRRMGDQVGYDRNSNGESYRTVPKQYGVGDSIYFQPMTNQYSNSRPMGSQFGHNRTSSDGPYRTIPRQYGGADVVHARTKRGGCFRPIANQYAHNHANNRPLSGQYGYNRISSDKSYRTIPEYVGAVSVHARTKRSDRFQPIAKQYAHDLTNNRPKGGQNDYNRTSRDDFYKSTPGQYNSAAGIHTRTKRSDRFQPIAKRTITSKFGDADGAFVKMKHGERFQPIAYKYAHKHSNNQPMKHWHTYDRSSQAKSFTTAPSQQSNSDGGHARPKRSSGNINNCASQCAFGYLDVLDDNRVPSETAVVKYLQDHVQSDRKRIRYLREARRCFAQLATTDNEDGCGFSKMLAKCLKLESE